MKHSELRSIGHNVADWLACGMGLMIGVFQTDVSARRRARGGAITVDRLEGTVVEGDPSPSLRRAVALYADSLPAFCARHGGSIGDRGRIRPRPYGW